MKRKLIWVLAFVLLAAVPGSAQQSVTVKVDLSKSVGVFEPVWAWVGHDEPNYTYTEEGRELLRRLSQLSPDPVHDRTHNLLTSGDGTPALKWGSTNAFTRDASGKPVYNWKIIDQIFDTYQATGITPFVEIGFMPQALSRDPEPYRHNWPKNFDTGWAYPPENEQEWSDLVYNWVRHLVERYGASQVTGWEWEVWNEPDIFYWHGTVDEYNKFYDYTVAAVRRALPNARVGGPATTGPANPRAAAFLRAFLEHCASGQNYATGKREFLWTSSRSMRRDRRKSLAVMSSWISVRICATSRKGLRSLSRFLHSASCLLFSANPTLKVARLVTQPRILNLRIV